MVDEGKVFSFFYSGENEKGKSGKKEACNYHIHTPEVKSKLTYFHLNSFILFAFKFQCRRKITYFF